MSTPWSRELFINMNKTVCPLYLYVQFSSVTQSCPTLFDFMDFSTPGFPVHHQLLELTQTLAHHVGDAIQPSHSLSSPSAFNLSQHLSFPMSWFFASGGQSNWSFSFSISPSNEYSGLIYFRTEWLDLLAVKGTQEFSPTPQFKSINSSVLSLLYGPTLTPYMTTGKTIALTKQTFLGKVMSLLFNMLSRLVITFLPRSKWLLIPWLQSSSTVILEPKK